MDNFQSREDARWFALLDEIMAAAPKTLAPKTLAQICDGPLRPTPPMLLDTGTWKGLVEGIHASGPQGLSMGCHISQSKPCPSCGEGSMNYQVGVDWGEARGDRSVWAGYRGSVIEHSWTRSSNRVNEIAAHIWTERAAREELREALGRLSGPRLYAYGASARQEREGGSYVFVSPCYHLLPSPPLPWGWQAPPRILLVAMASPLLVIPSARDSLLVRIVSSLPFPHRAREADEPKEEFSAVGWYMWELVGYSTI